MRQVPAQQLLAHLQQGVQPLYMLCGEEPLQQLEALDAIRNAIKQQGEYERASFIVTGAGFDWSEPLASLAGMGLFSQIQLTEINIPSAKPGREGGAVLQQLAQTIAKLQDVYVVLLLPQYIDRATKNSAWFKALSQVGVVVDCLPIEGHTLLHWLADRLKQAGLQVESGEAGKQLISFLAEHVEGNLLAAHQEIEKLALLKQANKEAPQALSFDEAQRSIMNVARYDLFSLPQTVLSGQLAKAVRMLDGLLSEGQATVRIHWVLASEIQSLWQVRQSLDEGKPMPLALREARVWGVRERLYERVLPQMATRDCLRLVRYAHMSDGVMKGLPHPSWPSEPADAIRKLFLEMLDVVAGAGRSSMPMKKVAL